MLTSKETVSSALVHLLLFYDSSLPCFLLYLQKTQHRPSSGNAEKNRKYWWRSRAHREMVEKCRGFISTVTPRDKKISTNFQTQAVVWGRRISMRPTSERLQWQGGGFLSDWGIDWNGKPVGLSKPGSLYGADGSLWLQHPGDSDDCQVQVPPKTGERVNASNKMILELRPMAAENIHRFSLKIGHV